jgi:hypothetical protein
MVHLRVRKNKACLHKVKAEVVKIKGWGWDKKEGTWGEEDKGSEV